MTVTVSYDETVIVTVSSNTMRSLMCRHAICIDVDISGRKSGTERTKKRIKLVRFFPPPEGTTGTVVHRWSRRYTDFSRATITRDIFIMGPTRPRLSQNTHNFAERISFAEHRNLVAESSEFHLTLNRAHRAHFPNSKYAKKTGHFI